MKRFNIRVYGIIVNHDDEVLIADERRFGYAFTKFPGGGLEWGEGLKEGLKRELKEELGLEATIGDLIYVNDFFQQSAFREEDQILSFYFKVTKIDFERIPLGDFRANEQEGECFRWINRKELSEEQFTFPIDKVVAGLLVKHSL